MTVRGMCSAHHSPEPCVHALTGTAPLLACRVLAEYLECAPAGAVSDALEALAGPALLHCVHSRPGAGVAARVFVQGSAKQRKKVIKAMKGAPLSLSPSTMRAMCICSRLSEVLP